MARNSIDFQDPFIHYLAVFHLVMFGAVLWARRRHAVLIFIMTSAVVLVLNAERINRAAMINWRSFARRPYFDRHGKFITISFSVPLMLNILLVAVLLMTQAAQLLIKLKRRELSAGKKNS